MGLTFSSYIIYKFLLFAFVLFAFFRLSFLLIPVIIKKNKYIKLTKRNLPIFEFFIWILFSIWAFKEFLIYNQYFAIALFIIMLAIAIFSVRIILKDYMAGVIIKTDVTIMVGDTISSSEYSGIITKFNYRTLELELQNRSIVKIPYTEILNNSLVKEKQSKSISGHSFKLTTSKKHDIETLKISIKKTILLLPWASTKQKPTISLLDETNNTYIFELSIFAFNKDMYFKIEKYIKDKFSVIT